MSRKKFILIVIAVLVASSFVIGQENKYPPFIKEMMDHTKYSYTTPFYGQSVVWGTACYDDSVEFLFLAYYTGYEKETGYLKMVTNIIIEEWTRNDSAIVFEGRVIPLIQGDKAFPEGWLVKYEQDFTSNIVTIITTDVRPVKWDDQEKRYYVSVEVVKSVIMKFMQHPSISQVEIVSSLVPME